MEQSGDFDWSVWLGCPEKVPMFRSALNKLIELNAKDINLRIKVASCEIDGKGNIIVADSSSNAA